MTDRQLMQETENSIKSATKALEQAAISAKELKEIMESRTPKVINRMFEISSSPEAAIALILSMGYSKEEIRACGYNVE